MPGPYPWGVGWARGGVGQKGFCKGNLKKITTRRAQSRTLQQAKKTGDRQRVCKSPCPPGKGGGAKYHSR